MRKKLAIFAAILLLFFINSCTDNKAKTVPKFDKDKHVLEKKSITDIKIDAEIILNSLISSKHLYYDTCLTEAMAQLFERDKTLTLNFVDESLLKYFSKNDTSQKVEDINQWNFLRNSTFNSLTKAFDKKNKSSAGEFWQEITNERYILILQERKKILPRTNFEHYVLGGMFDGGIFLYDVLDYKNICYFNFRVNNTSNKIEFYEKYKNSSTYDAMLIELKEQLKLNLDEKIKLKFGESAQVKIKY